MTKLFKAVCYGSNSQVQKVSQKNMIAKFALWIALVGDYMYIFLQYIVIKLINYMYVKIENPLVNT